MNWSKIETKLERYTTESLNGKQVLGQNYTAVRLNENIDLVPQSE